GRPATIIIDTHGEYTLLFKSSKIAGVEIIDAEQIRLSTPFLTQRSFYNYIPNMSPVQGRELIRIFNELKATRKAFDLDDLIETVQSDTKLGNKTKDALVGWLYLLNQYGIFSKREIPKLHELLKPGRVIVINMANLTSIKHKQILVDYIATRSFYLRKNDSIPPICIFLEEAHQFVPQSAQSLAISRKSIEIIAREGRKFFASICLISQRPVNLSTTVLSQCNTHFILRVSNPYDLDHIRATSEKITSDALKMISSLPVGHALVVGSAVNVPVFFKVRSRSFLKSGGSSSLIDCLKKFDK
ncbi:MAG: ATP-binding protein, partial [Promethearchaeota archaeon]